MSCGLAIHPENPTDPTGESAGDERQVSSEDAEQILSLLRRARELLKGMPAATPGATVFQEEDTNFARVKRYLQSVHNAPSTTSQIRKATGIPRGALSNLLYTTHKKYFEWAESPTHRRQKLWSLKVPRINESAAGVAGVKDLAGLSAHECCRRILLEHGNHAMHALSLAKEAIRRGYFGRGRYSGDELEWVTAKSFWARLSRTNKNDFEQPKHMYFRLRDPSTPARPQNLFGASDEQEEQRKEH